jgi:hypothetical protein
LQIAPLLILEAFTMTQKNQLKKWGWLSAHLEKNGDNPVLSNYLKSIGDL